LKRENTAAKRNGDTIPDARARKMTRYVSGMVIETLEVPLSEEERQVQLDAILARAGNESRSLGEMHISNFQSINNFENGASFMTEDWSENINGLDDRLDPLPEPVPVSDFQLNITIIKYTYNLFLVGR